MYCYFLYHYKLLCEFILSLTEFPLPPLPWLTMPCSNLGSWVPSPTLLFILSAIGLECLRWPVLALRLSTVSLSIEDFPIPPALFSLWTVSFVACICPPCCAGAVANCCGACCTGTFCGAVDLSRKSFLNVLIKFFASLSSREMVSLPNLMVNSRNFPNSDKILKV